MLSDAQDMAVARQLRQAGLVAPEQLQAALQAQGRALEQGRRMALAEALVQVGAITPTQRENLERQFGYRRAGLQQLGEYRLLRKLGEGGMGAVYLAEDPALSRRVALKILPPRYAAEPEFVKRFRREAQAAARLEHPNIVRAYACGEDLGYHFYVMEYCEGESLEDALRRHGLFAWRQALEIVLQVARGLRFAHGHGIVHRDVKPANVFMTTAGVAKLLDLGLAKMVDESRLSFKTVTGAVLGSPHYISPEQARGHAEIDGRADIYSLGATLYHLVTGEVPFTGATLYEILSKHVSAELPNPQDLAEDVPDGVVHLVRKMMAKQPGDRYDDCGALIKDLELVLAGGAPQSAVLAPGASTVAALRKRSQPARKRRAGTYRVLAPDAPAKRPPALLWPGLGAAAILVVVIAIAAVSGSKPRPEPARPPRSAAGPPPDRTARDPASPREEAARLTLQAARDYARQNPKDLAGQASRFRHAAFAADGTLVAAAARREYDASLKRQRDVIPEAPPPDPPALVPPSQPKAPSAPAANEGWVDLLPRIDPARDAVWGIWSKRNDGGLDSDATGDRQRGPARLEIPCELPEEYDFRVVFTRQGGKDAIVQILRGPGSSFWWSMGGDSNTVFGFGLVGGRGPAENATKKLRSIGNGHRYTSVVEVRRDSVRAFMDGERVSEWRPNLGALGIPVTMDLRTDGCLGVGSWASATTFHRIEVRPLGGPAPPPAPRENVEDPARWEKAIDLLSLADPARDAVQGRWSWRARGLHSDDAAPARLEFPYQPPEEYEFRVVFTPLGTTPDLGQLLSRSGRPFNWFLGWKGNKYLGFGDVDGNVAGVLREPCLQAGRRHSSVVRVLEGGVEGYLDGRLITSLGTDYGNLSSGMKRRDPSALGLWSWTAPTVFHSAAVLEIAGSGRVTRPESALPFLWGIIVENRQKLAGLPLAYQKAELKKATFTVKEVADAALTIEARVAEGGSYQFKEAAEGLPETVVVELLRHALGDIPPELRRRTAFLFAERGRFDQARQELEAARAAGVDVTSAAAVIEEKAKSRAPTGSAERAIDLLKLIDPGQDAVLGVWRSEGQSLVSPLDAAPYVRVPYAPPDEYDLAFTCERRRGTEGLILGLAAQKAQFAVVFDVLAAEGGLSGLERLDGQQIRTNGSARRGLLFKKDRPSEVVCTLRKDGIVVSVDGERIVDWKGDYARLSLNPVWPKVPGVPAPFVMTLGTEYRISRMTLTPVSGQGKPLR